MSARKTTPNDADVDRFLDAVEHQQRRRDAIEILNMMRRLTGAEPQMWGSSIVGFGHQTYTTADGAEHDWFAVGFAPRKSALTVYNLTYYGSNADLLERLGNHSTGKGCLYIKNLDQVDREVLAEMITRAWDTNHQDADV